MFDKTYNYKIYDRTGTQFLKTLPVGIVKNTPSFNSQIKGGFGECRLELSLPFENFGEGSFIQFRNIVEIYQTDRDHPLGRLIYRGFISSYEPFINKSDEGVAIILLGMISLAKFAYYKAGSNFQVVHSGQDPSVIMKAIADHFISIYGSGLISYDGSSVLTAGNNATYTFDEDTWYDSFQNAFGTISAAGWWWVVDHAGKLFVQPKPSTPTHTFTIRKDTDSLRILKNSEKIINAVRIKYNNNATYDQDDAASIALYGRREKIISDTKIINLATAQARATQEIENNKKDKLQATLIVNDKYDIESIKVGDTCKLRNLKIGTTTVDDNLQIVSVQYNSDQVTIQLEEINDSFGLALGQFISSS